MLEMIRHEKVCNNVTETPECAAEGKKRFGLNDYGIVALTILYTQIGNKKLR